MFQDQTELQHQWPNWSDSESQNPNNSFVKDEEKASEDLNPPTIPSPYDDEPIVDPVTNEVQNTHLPFISEVEEFNTKFNKPNNYIPTVPGEKEWKFVYDFILEELEEYKEACEKGDIIGVLDALCDITYVSLGNGTMLHGLKTKIWPAYREIQSSNLSKACSTPQEALDTVEYWSKKLEEECHVEQINDMYIVYRTRDRKVMKSVNYYSPNLEQYFSRDEIINASSPQTTLKNSILREGFGIEGGGLIKPIEDLRENLTHPPTQNEISSNIPESNTEDYW